MIQETELNLFVPSPELLVRLASGDRPLGVRAGPPRVKSIRETFFDTPNQSLRRRGMTCKLRQVEGEGPAVVVTVGEGPDSEGITSRSRLTADAVGTGVFETLRGDSAPATQVQKFVDPGQLRPQIALDIQRLGRVFRGGLMLKPVLLLFFDRIQVQSGISSTVFHEISIRRRRSGGPQIRDLARSLRDEYHLFPDGLNRLQRAYRMLGVEGKKIDIGLSPYGLSLALALFREGRLGLLEREGGLKIPTFRGSGEDAARALSADLTGTDDLPLLRLGTTEPREGRVVAELWTIPESDPLPEASSSRSPLFWIPWREVLEEAGRPDLRDPTLISTLLLLSRKRLLGHLPWVEGESGPMEGQPGELNHHGQPQGGSSDREPAPAAPLHGPPSGGESMPPGLDRAGRLFSILREVEDEDRNLKDRLEGVSRIQREVTWLFLQEVTRAKGRILSAEVDGGEEDLVQLVDLISIRVRGLVDRLYRCVTEDLVGRLEAAGVYLRPWEGLMHADRVHLLEAFETQHLPSMEVAGEWGPAFIPDMPMAGTAVGVLARLPGVEGPRFFHVVLGQDPPAFMAVPGSTTILPLEEVVRGYLMSHHKELERAETHAFRFTTGACLVKEWDHDPAAPPSDVEEPEEEDAYEDVEGAAKEVDENVEPVPEEPTPVGEPSARRHVESRQSVVVRVLVHRTMPESYQAQLLRALERQVNRRNPLIGWSDLYPVTGPLDLSGLEEFLEQKTQEG